MRLSSLALSVTLLGLAGAASAQTPIPLTISGSQATGSITLPGGVAADLTISFEGTTGLTQAALGVTAEIVNPLDVSLLSRLPGVGVGIPAAFPVLVKIDPAPGSTLTFTGVASVEFHTSNLEYVPGSPLALYTAHAGGAFHDGTRSLGSGSARVVSGSGTFSEFMIVADTRPLDAVIEGKYDTLQATLNDGAADMPTATTADLQARLTQSRAQYESGSTSEAITELDGFSQAVLAQSGTTIPGVWQAGGGVVNDAGLLRAAADTLRYSLSRKAAGSP